MGNKPWYSITDTQTLVTPSLVVYPERIEKNIQTMVHIAGGTTMLRPHVKTHKMREVIEMQLHHGISKFKCATIAEAELVAESGAKDIVLALQPVGINIDRFFNLIKAYPKTLFSTIIDHNTVLNDIAAIAQTRDLKVLLWLDINNGMNRTGVQPGQEAISLYKTMHMHANITPMGLHVYDGHLRNPKLRLRKETCDDAFVPVMILKQEIEQSLDISDIAIIAGGSPSFPIHAQRKGIYTSPGTTLLWDAGYGGLFKEMPFLPAAVLLTRVISKPAPNLLCLDLGHKSVASEMQFPRVLFLGMEDCTQIGQSEEHLVLESPNADTYPIGHLCYAIPMHICPTVAKYDSVWTVHEHRVTGSWKVAARDHRIHI